MRNALSLTILAGLWVPLAGNEAPAGHGGGSSFSKTSRNLWVETTLVDAERGAWTWSLKAKGDRPDLERQVVTTDELGRVRAVEIQGADGTWHERLLVDEHGTLRGHQARRGETVVREEELDAEGRLVRQKRGGSGETLTELREHGGPGGRISKKSFLRNGVPLSSVRWIWAEGRVAREDRLDASGALVDSSVFEYPDPLSVVEKRLRDDQRIEETLVRKLRTDGAVVKESSSRGWERTTYRGKNGLPTGSLLHDVGATGRLPVRRVFQFFPMESPREAFLLDERGPSPAVLGWRDEISGGREGALSVFRGAGSPWVVERLVHLPEVAFERRDRSLLGNDWERIDLDAEERPILLQRVDATGRSVFQRSWSYDVENRLKTETRFDSDRRPLSSRGFVYGPAASPEARPGPEEASFLGEGLFSSLLELIEDRTGEEIRDRPQQADRANRALEALRIWSRADLTRILERDGKGELRRFVQIRKIREGNSVRHEWRAFERLSDGAQGRDQALGDNLRSPATYKQNADALSKDQVTRFETLARQSDAELAKAPIETEFLRRVLSFHSDLALTSVVHAERIDFSYGKPVRTATIGAALLFLHQAGSFVEREFAASLRARAATAPGAKKRTAHVEPKKAESAPSHGGH